MAVVRVDVEEEEAASKEADDDEAEGGSSSGGGEDVSPVRAGEEDGKGEEEEDGEGKAVDGSMEEVVAREVTRVVNGIGTAGEEEEEEEEGVIGEVAMTAVKAGVEVEEAEE